VKTGGAQKIADVGIASEEKEKADDGDDDDTSSEGGTTGEIKINLMKESIENRAVFGGRTQGVWAVSVATTATRER